MSEVLTSTPIKTEKKEKYDNKQTKSKKVALFGNEGEKKKQAKGKQSTFYYEHHY